ncbi:MAG TPA: alpha/beta hydrolase [Candidatus Nitrosopolaris sp.]|nr:alpha/beta hydrolase [Candidatus Nitrosopolaris sp.]
MATVSQHRTRRRGRWEEVAASVLPDLRNLGSWEHIPPMWREGRIYLEYLSLIRDPVYRGLDVPAGLGRPVILIPGFLAGDWTLRTPFGWLRRIGYRPQLAGMAFNVMYSEVMLRPLLDALQHLQHRTGARVSLVGHSRGGVLAKVLSHRKPDLVEQVITLGSPINDPFDIHPLTMAGVRAAHLYNIFRYGHPASVEMRFLRDLAAPPKVPITSIYSRSDGVVNWRACLRRDVNAIEVKGSHVGLALNPEVYRILAHLLPAPWRAV